jgi:predicted DNA-binding transcriptional regulator AlpA
MMNTRKRFLSYKEVEEITGRSRQSIWRAIKAGDFPAPVVVGKRAVAFRESDILEWMASRPRPVAYLNCRVPSAACAEVNSEPDREFSRKPIAAHALCIQKPEAVPVDPGRIPDELKGRRQWVCWCYKYRKSKWTKPPCQPNGRPATVDNLATWSRFDDVLAAYKCGGFDGIGFVLTAGDPYVAIDLDHCRDPETGKIEPPAQNIIHQLASSEVSPSATGIRIIATGKLPPRGRRTGRVEIYDDLRFVSLTGHCLPGTPTTIESRQAKIEDFHRAVFLASSRRGHARRRCLSMTRSSSSGPASRRTARSSLPCSTAAIGVGRGSRPKAKATRPCVRHWLSSPAVMRAWSIGCSVARP